MGEESDCHTVCEGGQITVISAVIRLRRQKDMDAAKLL